MMRRPPRSKRTGTLVPDTALSRSAGGGNVLIFMAIGAATGFFVWGPLDRGFNTRKWLLAIGIGVQFSCLATIAAVPGLGVMVITVLFAVMGLMNGCKIGRAHV